ncbi:MAG TPA: hypothetical protein GX405_00225 [Rhizobiales bacterium]|nr:hypothetical protein [Hyphomicrobiales bacterium]
MANPLREGMWFVRSNGGAGSYPVTPEGWRTVRLFVVGVVATAAVSVAAAVFGPPWLWPILFAVGIAWFAWRFIDTARRHTDHSVTYDDIMKDKKNA